MQSLKLILLFPAYTLGIFSLALQIACYRKKLEYRETVFFSLSLLILILLVYLKSLFPDRAVHEFGYLELLIFPAYLFFGVTIPLNIHQERIHSNRRKKNLIVWLAGLLALSLCILFYLRYGIKPVLFTTGAFIYIMVSYSMIFILMTRPDSLIRFREKKERNNAVFILLIMNVSLLIFMVRGNEEYSDVLQRYDGFTLALIAIVLTLGKIPEDLNKLSGEETLREISQDKLDQSGISKREREVLPLLVSGKTYREIADSLFISLPTVKTHVSSIYSKLNVRNRLELANLMQDKKI